MSKQALIVIDLQNDYFPGGKFPLWNTEATLAHNEAAIAKARMKGIPVILVQHVADASRGEAPFFNAGTPGVELHPRLLAAAPDGLLVSKSHADGFHHTPLEQTLAELGCEELLIGGMMTQNCVTHTAISRAADRYAVTVLTDCCTSVSQMIHLIALNALSTRVTLADSATVL